MASLPLELRDKSVYIGTPRKLLDIFRLARLGWRATTSREDGVTFAYDAYLRETNVR